LFKVGRCNSTELGKTRSKTIGIIAIPSQLKKIKNKKEEEEEIRDEDVNAQSTHIQKWSIAAICSLEVLKMM